MADRDALWTPAPGDSAKVKIDDRTGTVVQVEGDRILIHFVPDVYTNTPARTSGGEFEWYQRVDLVPDGRTYTALRPKQG